MRLSPPVASVLPREVLSGGIDVDGEHFLEGTVIGVPAYTLHHKRQYYPDPFAYRPERWLVGDFSNENVAAFTAEDVALAQSAFCPFSIGPRGCIGKGVAYLELTIALARVIWLYDMRLTKGEDIGRDNDGGYKLVDCFVAQKDGPVVEFKLRV